MSDQIIRNFERYMGADEPAPTFDPQQCAHAFAMKYGLRVHLTYEQAAELERDLTTHLQVWLEDPS